MSGLRNNIFVEPNTFFPQAHNLTLMFRALSVMLFRTCVLHVRHFAERVPLPIATTYRREHSTARALELQTTPLFTHLRSSKFALNIIKWAISFLST